MLTDTARTIARSTLLIFWLLLPAVSSFAQPAGPSPTPSQRLERAEWSLVRPTPVITVHIRRVLGYAMLVPAFTLFLLYLFRPRPYVVAGAFAFAAGSMMLLVLSVDSGGTRAVNPDTITTGRLGIGAWSFAALFFGASLRLASGWFRAESLIPRSMFWAVVAGSAWVIFGAALFPRPGAILVPAFLLMTTWHVISAYGFLKIVRQHRFVGAAMAAAGVFGIAVVNIVAASVAIANRGIGQASTNVAYYNFLASALLILGMHLLIFEDLIEELRGAAADLATSRDEMKAMAVTDPLTRCYNRRLLYEIAEHELEQHRRYRLPLSILYIDIDHFKAINDTRGHHTGDEVLKTMGAILRELTRQADYVFRWGGDEFVVLLSASEADAKNKANQIRRAFLESVIVGNLPDGVDVSIGCVPVPADTKDFDPLIDQADREMYRRKRALAS
ncbi:MAG TPA: GGDEF domain-containing protein [Vicinamibacterales bacterium]|nr:GGDEF domain-containing protein [Vicinamibacterales bacterium]